MGPLILLPKSVAALPFAGELREVLGAVLGAIDPFAAVEKALVRTGDELCAAGTSFDLRAIGNIVVVGAGKAGEPMAAAVNALLADRLGEGLVAVPRGTLEGTSRTGSIRLFESSHPIPDDSSAEAGRAVAALLASLEKDDLAVVLISGGASALLELPAPGLALRDLQATTALLLRSGVDIGELNAVRKHLSAIKGGGLARLAAPARSLGLYCSDVVGDRLEVIGSGPTAADPSTFAMALEVLERRNLRGAMPKTVLDHLEAGRVGTVSETLKAGDPILGRVQNQVVTGIASAAAAAARAAERCGFQASVVSTKLSGEAREVGAQIARACAAEQIRKRPVCLVYGGETTVTVRGQGKGGRNQELALGAASSLALVPRSLLVAWGTDGRDGPTEAAGAVVTSDTLKRAMAQGLEPERFLDNNDSYHFFEALGDLLVTGPTRANAADLVLVVLY